MSDVLVASAEPVQAGLSPRDLKRRYAGAFRPQPIIYWLDMLASAAVGWGAFVVAGQAELGSLTNIAATAISALALLRAALFIHELAHLKTSALPGFEIAWHVAVGLPLMLPSLMYVGSHGDHHRRSHFGTERDPEYAAIARWSRLRIALFVLNMVFFPPIFALRWGVLGPLSYLIPPLRRIVVERASTLVINADYRRPTPCGATARRWAIQEAAAAAFFWAVMSALYFGWISPVWLVQWWIVAALVLIVNQVRTLVAHVYENEGEPLDTMGQLLDSINLHGQQLVNAVAAPVGLRYHALHHFLPVVPYHSLGTLHRRLLTELPLESPYRRTARPGLVPALRELWQKASSRSGERQPLT